MRKLSFIIVLAMLVSLLAGCAGTAVVYYSDCTCPVGVHETQAPAVQQPDVQQPAVQAPEDKETVSGEGALKTGLAVCANARKSVSASAEAAGTAEFDITFAAVVVDENGVIVDCVIDCVGTTVKFDTNGVIDPTSLAEVSTKNELGEAYGMKLYGGSAYEWNEQAAALCDYAVGKTVQELREGAVSESGHAVDADLASHASIYLGGYVDAIEKAVANATVLGAQQGDDLRLAVIASLGDSVSADGENKGTAQLNCDVTALTMADDKITSCVIDSIQAKVSFDGAGQLGELAEMLTKNELGEAYGMKMYAGSAYEWNEQAAAFASYVTGMTVEEVLGISVNERTAPTDADISSTVTIAVAGFKALIEKAGK